MRIGRDELPSTQMRPATAVALGPLLALAVLLLPTPLSPAERKVAALTLWMVA